jgi:hypothetical protein
MPQVSLQKGQPPAVNKITVRSIFDDPDNVKRMKMQIARGASLIDNIYKACPIKKSVYLTNTLYKVGSDDKDQVILPYDDPVHMFECYT